jgi:hypothetical protein
MRGDTDLLGMYLQDHYAGSTAGVALFERAARSHSDPGTRARIAELAREVSEDRAEQLRIMAAVGVQPHRLKDASAWAVEKLGRLKPNGFVLRRSPLSDVLELEALQVALSGKAAGWSLLRTLADDDPRLDIAQLDWLLARVDRQLDVVQELRLGTAKATFAPPPADRGRTA